MTNKPGRAYITNISETEAVICPCGTAKRALYDCEIFPGTIHETEFDGRSKTHYHKTLTETYYVLSAETGAGLEVDGVVAKMKQGMCIVIPPGVRHRGIGRFKVLNIVLPKFDPADEWFD